MKYSKYVLFFMLANLLGIKAEAQGYDVKWKWQNEALFVRLLPTNIPDFLRVINGEIKLELYQVEGDMLEPKLQLVEERDLAPISFESWKNGLSTSVWDSALLTAIYPFDVPPVFVDNFLVEDGVLANTERLGQLRFGLNEYAGNYEWLAIEKSGFGFRSSKIEKKGIYALKLYPMANQDTLWVDVDLEAYTPPEVPTLEADFSNRKATLAWRTLEFKNDFFGWYLDRSLDAGTSWEALYDLPYINDYDTLQNKGEDLKYLNYEDILPENDIPVMYRLSGADYLGGRSENTAIVIGEGKRDLAHSPLLTATEQTDSNYAVIHWEIRPEDAKLIREFRVLETDTTGQNYRIALASISPSARQVVVPMKFRSNFFRIQAVSFTGKELTSFESLVMCYDVTPPAVPANFTGYIDSVGLAHFSWEVSGEVDLSGYYLFKGYFEEVELAMITPEPLTGPKHTDTVNMVTGNEWVYYQLRSVDFRGNSSGFTPLLKLKKPDVYPPAPPQITHIDNDGRHIELEWTTSPSFDVAKYALYRREVETETDFGLLLSFSVDDFQERYVDSLVQPKRTYIYTLLATDDDGLESAPAQPVSMRLKDYGLRSAINAFMGTVQTDGSISLEWAYEETPWQYYLYKGSEDAPLSLLKVLNGADISYQDEAVRPGETYQYVLQAQFKAGENSPFTRKLIVKIPE